MPMGGLMQLVAYGAQDIYLSGRPQITFNMNRQRHQTFSLSTNETKKVTIEMDPRQKLRYMLEPLLDMHKKVVRKLDLNETFIVPVLRNTECPITYSEITDDFIECKVCKICYNYSDENVIKWFHSHNKCSLCRGEIDKTLKNIHGYNTIYSALKFEMNLKKHSYYDDDSDGDY